LVELLIVIGIMGLVMALMGPAFSSLQSSGQVTKAAADIQGVLEMARTRAMLDNTYVFVGFAESDGTSEKRPAPEGVGRIWVAAMATMDGQCTNLTASNLTPIGKIRYFDNAHLTNEVSSYTPTNTLSSNPVYLAPDSPLMQISWPLGASKHTVNGFNVGGIYFDPRGTANTNTNWVSLPQAIQMVLMPAKGSRVLTTGKNVVLIQVDGVTGAARCYRP
jgi:Tfp pilus assembly protein FimT